MKNQKKILKRIISLVIAGAAALSCMLSSGCGSQSTYNPNEGIATQEVTDDAGRTVECAETITKIAPSGATATLFLMTVAPEMMVGVASAPSHDQRPYIPEELWYLPTFGQFYGAKSTLNMEALIDAEPQIIIDTGDRKTTIKEDMTSIQKQTGIPTVFFEADLPHMAEAYRKIGKLLGKEEECEEKAEFIEKTIAMAEEKSAQIAEEDKLTVLYGTGSTGLSVFSEESSNAQVIEIIGAKNAVLSDVVQSGGASFYSMENVYKVDPDVIVLASGGPYDSLETNEWNELTAVKNGRYYEIPSMPYCWLSSPPSVNMVIGVWWLGQVVYPDVYNDYDIVEVAQEFYKLFWGYDLSEEEAKEMLSKSLYK